MTRLPICAILLLFVGHILAEEPPASGDLEKQNVEAALKLTRESAAKYEFSMTGKSDPLVLREQPILRWSNPERGQIYGNVFLWADRGRPVIAGSLFKWFSPFTHMSHEFHSLSAGEIRGRYNDADVWQSSQPGVSYAAVLDAPPVASTPTARLAQMRQLARQFTARTTDREGLKHELRLLAQPVYRYELEKDSVELSDGALFVFVQGTDPELWLMLEARPSAAKDSDVWQYALARMNSIAFDVQHNGRNVWHRDTLPSKEIYSHKAAYTSFQFNMP
jgi:hypothetical protein